MCAVPWDKAGPVTEVRPRGPRIHYFDPGDEYIGLLPKLGNLPIGVRAPYGVKSF